jgi:hypothetical protein
MAKPQLHIKPDFAEVIKPTGQFLSPALSCSVLAIPLAFFS